jgi:hypothetical protein
MDSDSEEETSFTPRQEQRFVEFYRGFRDDVQDRHLRNLLDSDDTFLDSSPVSSPMSSLESTPLSSPRDEEYGYSSESSLSSEEEDSTLPSPRVEYEPIDFDKVLRGRVPSYGRTITPVSRFSGAMGAQRLPQSLGPKPRTREDILESLSRDQLDVKIHKKVLDRLEELAKSDDMNSIKDVVELIKKDESAMEHVKDYPSQYRKVLGEMYDSFMSLFS